MVTENSNDSRMGERHGKFFLTTGVSNDRPKILLSSVNKGHW